MTDKSCPECERLKAEIQRLKEELLIVLGVVSESSDKLPAKEKLDA